MQGEENCSLSDFFIIYYLFLFMCANVFPASMSVWGEGGSPGSGVTDSWKLPYECCGLNLGPLEEQSVLLTTGPSLQPLLLFKVSYFIICFKSRQSTHQILATSPWLSLSSLVGVTRRFFLATQLPCKALFLVPKISPNLETWWLHDPSQNLFSGSPSCLQLTEMQKWSLS